MTLTTTNSFPRDLRRISARNYDLKKLALVVHTLLNEDVLSPGYRDHALHEEYAGLRECHMAFNWILLYRVRDGKLTLIRTGTRADIF